MIVQVRKQLARFFVWLARNIEPKSDYVNAYLMEQMTKALMDSIVYGKGAIRVEHLPYDSDQE